MIDRMKSPSHFTSQIIERFHPKGDPLGYPIGWDSMKIRILPAELSIWAGINGHGKSQFLGQVVLNAIAHGEKVAIASFEMRGDKLLSRMARQSLCQENPSESDLIDCMSWLDDNVLIYDFVGRGLVEDMLKNFQVCFETEGVTTFIIDSLMKCGLSEDDYAGQKFLVEDFHNFAMKNGVHVHLVAHARKMQDEKDRPGKMSIAGSAGIANIADNIYTVWRNKGKEEAFWKSKKEHTVLPESFYEAPDAIVECVKSRDMGSDVERQYYFWFDKESLQYLDDRFSNTKNYLMSDYAPF